MMPLTKDLLTKDFCTPTERHQDDAPVLVLTQSRLSRVCLSLCQSLCLSQPANPPTPLRRPAATATACPVRIPVGRSVGWLVGFLKFLGRESGRLWLPLASIVPLRLSERSRRTTARRTTLSP